MVKRLLLMSMSLHMYDFSQAVLQVIREKKFLSSICFFGGCFTRVAEKKFLSLN